MLASASSAAEAPLGQFGVAKVDITPASPIRLTGYASRRTESEGVEQRLWAKALAIGSDADKPALLLTVDNCGMTEAIAEELVKTYHIGAPRLRTAGVAHLSPVGSNASIRSFRAAAITALRNSS